MKRRGSFPFLVCSVFLAFLAQPAAALADQRVALVIGNSHYDHTAALANPANDATDVSQALKTLGFDVKLDVDVGKRQMDLDLEQFARASASADVSLFYYTGHGMQYQNRTYLMPKDAEVSDDISLAYQLTSMDEVKGAIERSNGVRIMVWDACRDNPLAQRFARSISSKTRDVPNVQGYARAEPTPGMIVVYAAQPNQVAYDGVERNSPFSTAFLEEVKEPGLDIVTMFARVSRDVSRATHGLQIPEVSISNPPEFYMNQTELDQAVWARIRDSADVETIREFIRSHPTSFYLPDAKARLELLEERQRRAIADQELEKQRQEAVAAEAARLQQERRESERNAAEAQAREKELATKLAAAEAEREKIAAELAGRIKAQSEIDRRLQADRAKADEELARREASVRAEIDNEKTTAAQIEKDRQLLEGLGKVRDDDEAVAKREQEAKAAADRELQAQLDRAQALKAEIASLEQQAAQAKANVRADEEKSADAQKAADAKNAVGAEKTASVTPPQPTAKVALTSEQLALVPPIRVQLRRLGCYFGADSEWDSTEMKRGVQKLARYAKLDSAPDSPTASFLDDLNRRQGRICPSECSALEEEVEGRCVAKPCGSGETLNRSGTCVANPSPKPQTKRQTALRKPAVQEAPKIRGPAKLREPSTGHCFNFNGSQYCE
jgi:hypothetical protein